MLDQINQISKTILNTGVTSIPKFLNETEVEKIKNFVGKPKKGSKEGNYPITISQLLAKIFKFEFKKLSNTFFLLKIAKKFHFKEIAAKALDSKDVDLQMIDCYYNERSPENIISWHNDIGCKNLDDKKYLKEFHEAVKSTFFDIKTETSPRGIKFFLYLTDVQKSNGSLAIIPYSNQIIKTLCTLIADNKIELKKFWSLKNLREFINDIKVRKLMEEKIGKEKIDTFLNETNFIISEKKDTEKYDLELDQGGLVIFDELCVHRGSAPQKTSRLVLRFIYRKKLN